VNEATSRFGGAISQANGIWMGWKYGIGEARRTAKKIDDLTHLNDSGQLWGHLENSELSSEFSLL
jgi:hypothetical protein